MKSPQNTELTGAEVLEFWRETQPEQRDRPYILTHAQRFAATINVVLSKLQPQSVLDIAGNSASRHIFSHYLSAASYQVTPKNLDIEIDDWHPHVAAGTYDLALCTEVIEHMSADPSYMLWQTNRALKPGGTLVLTTPNICSTLGTYNLLHGRAPYHWGVLMGTRGDRHQREYAPIELQELVAANGFRTSVQTADVYEHGESHQLAKAWVAENVQAAAPEFAGDTIIIVATKVEALPEPIRLAPVYETSIAATRDEQLLARLAANMSESI